MLFAAQAAQVLAGANMMLASVPTTGRTEFEFSPLEQGSAPPPEAV